MALTERLALLISANGEQAFSTFSRLEKKMLAVDTASVRTGKHLGAAVTGGAVLAGVALGKMVADGVRALEVQQRIDAQTRAVLKSTGGAAGVTAKQVSELAGTIGEYSAQGAGAVKTSENLLLTFTAIKNQAGAGNDIFDQTTKAVIDMSIALNEDLKNASIQVGKALNNPLVGLTALRRVGVSFTEQQVAQIKALTENGRLLDAQKIILKELNTEFAGSGEAAGETAAGGIEKFHHEITRLDKTLAGPLLQPLTTGAQDLARAMDLVNEHPIAIKAVESIVGVSAAAILASKGLGLLRKVRESELATVLRGNAARAASVEALNAEAAAATRAAGAVGALDAAEAAGGAAGGRRGFRAAVGGSAAAQLGVFALDSVLVPKAIDSALKVPDLLKAHKQGNELSDVIKRYNEGQLTFGQNRALETLGPEVDTARAAAARGDYSKLAEAVEAVNKALADNADVYDLATVKARGYLANAKVSADAARQALKDLVEADEKAKEQLRAQAATAEAFGDPTAKSSVLNTSVAVARTRQRSAADAVTVAEDRLVKLRGNSKTTAQQLEHAESALARAKERAGLAGDRVAEAEKKAATAHGLSAKQLLANVQANAAYEQTAAKAAGKLVKAGLSQDALTDLLQNVESKTPGTLTNLAASITPALIKGLNSSRQRFSDAYVALWSSPNAVAEQAARVRGNRLAQAEINAYIAAWKAQYNATPPGLRPPVQGPNIRPPVQGPPIRPGIAPYGSAATYNFNGPIVANNTSQIIAEAQRQRRLAALAGEAGHR